MTTSELWYSRFDYWIVGTILGIFEMIYDFFTTIFCQGSKRLPKSKIHGMSHKPPGPNVPLGG